MQSVHLNLPSKAQQVCNPHSINHKDSSIQVLQKITERERERERERELSPSPMIKLDTHDKLLEFLQKVEEITQNNLRCTVMPCWNHIGVISMFKCCASKVDKLDSTRLWQILEIRTTLGRSRYKLFFKIKRNEIQMHISNQTLTNYWFWMQNKFIHVKVSHAPWMP